MQEARVWSLGQEGALEKEMATHSSILASETPWTEEPGGLLSKGLQVGPTERLNQGSSEERHFTLSLPSWSSILKVEFIYF